VGEVRTKPTVFVLTTAKEAIQGFYKAPEWNVSNCDIPYALFMKSISRRRIPNSLS